jgi:hypothetical protein
VSSPPILRTSIPQPLGGVALTVLALAFGFALAAPAHAQSAGASGRFLVELRVIEGTPYAAGAEGEKQVVDAKLAAFAKDLKALPFKELKLVDAHTTGVREGERISLEIPGVQKNGAPKRRFLQVAAHGRQPGGKLRFQLSIDALKFDTLVAVPDGGTIFVAVPKTQGPAMLFAFTARSQ